ncbi:MAG: heavy-metal-associated domain-containing protein [Chloroflexi bacterium]|nr:heavy-metal-associated domain-containing protein [Chloroflexota bacterium]
MPGVIAYNVDFDGDSATVLYDAKTATVEQLKQAIAVAGYQVGNVRQVER